MKVLLAAHGCQDSGTLEANHGLDQFCGSLLVTIFKKDGYKLFQMSFDSICLIEEGTGILIKSCSSYDP